MSSMTGTGSSVRALNSEQHRPDEVVEGNGSIELEPQDDDNLHFTGLVPQGLLRDIDKKRKRVLVTSVRKATNLYRRVATVDYSKRLGKVYGKHIKASSVKCLACLVTLVKSSKDSQRAGIKLRCQCNARVCVTCFENDQYWYLTEPHFTSCSTMQEFICTVCSCFDSSKEKVCCVWMCSRCCTEQLDRGVCSQCSGSLPRHKRRETRSLWCLSNVSLSGEKRELGEGDDACAEEKTSDYRDLIKSRVFDKVSRSRHLSASDVRILFPECFAPQICTCTADDDRNPLCASCTPVLTLMQLLAKNPRPLIASFSELAIPGRVLARNVYDRALLNIMLNDRDLPPCANGRSCKGMLVCAQNDPRPLPSLISPESYHRFVLSKTVAGQGQQIGPCSCILCLLFNQSAAIAQMLSSDGLRLEPHPSGPVYYFNIKLAPDVGVPEVCVAEYEGYIVNFEGSVGSYKPTVYYNWRDMLKMLSRDKEGVILLSLPTEQLL